MGLDKMRTHSARANNIEHLLINPFGTSISNKTLAMSSVQLFAANDHIRKVNQNPSKWLVKGSFNRKISEKSAEGCASWVNLLTQI